MRVGAGRSQHPRCLRVSWQALPAAAVRQLRTLVGPTLLEQVRKERSAKLDAMDAGTHVPCRACGDLFVDQHHLRSHKCASRA
jgi:hypothetical protein